MWNKTRQTNTGMPQRRPRRLVCVTLVVVCLCVLVLFNRYVLYTVGVPDCTHDDVRHQSDVPRHLGAQLSGEERAFLDVYTDNFENRRKMHHIIRKIALSPHKLRNNYLKLSRPVLETPQAKEVMNLTNQRRGGVFVECGANDGERSSNTIALEQRRGWRGLLVEMDPYFYTQLVGKRRKTWNFNGCLSPKNGPFVTQIKESILGEGKLVQEGKNVTLSPFSVACFPLNDILLALNLTKIGYFSLDVEGLEFDILKTIDYETIHIDIISAEYKHNKVTPEEMVKFMDSKHYEMVKKLSYYNQKEYLGVEDLIFQKRH